MPLTKQQIAIKCYYEGRRKAKNSPRDRIVLGGKVKLTPRRREALFHVGCTDGIRWREERDWSNRWENHRIFVPYLGETNITTIVKYLLARKLVRYSPEGGRPRYARQPFAFEPVLLITTRGMDALLECVGGLL